MQIHELPTISGSPSSGYFATDNGSQTTKIDYDALAKAIIEQYSASTLAGSAQSVQAALDGIKADSVLTRGASETVTASTNLNDYTTPGTYFFNSGTKAVNAPANSGYFRLVVTAPTGSLTGTNRMRYQEAVTTDGRVFTRRLNSSDGGRAWVAQDWAEVPTRAEVDALNSKETWYTIPAANTQAEMLAAVDGWLDATGASHLSGYLNGGRATTFGLPVSTSCYLDMYSNSANFKGIVAHSASPTNQATFVLLKENGEWNTTWIRIASNDANSMHFGTEGNLWASSARFTASTDINHILTGEWFWSDATNRPSKNIPDNNAVRGRLWALDSGGGSYYCTQICYTSSFKWFVRYCTSRSAFAWTDWAQIPTRAEVDALSANTYEELASDASSGTVNISRYGKMRILTFTDVVASGNAINLSAALATTDRPRVITGGVLFASDNSIARVWVRLAGTIGTTNVTSGKTYNGELVYIVA